MIVEKRKVIKLVVGIILLLIGILMLTGKI